MATKQDASLLTKAHRDTVKELAEFHVKGGRVAMYEDTSDPSSNSWSFGYLKVESPAKREEGTLFQVRKNGDRSRFLQMAMEASQHYVACVKEVRSGGEAPKPKKRRG